MSSIEFRWSEVDMDDKDETSTVVVNCLGQLFKLQYRTLEAHVREDGLAGGVFMGLWKSIPITKCKEKDE